MTTNSTEQTKKQDFDHSFVHTVFFWLKNPENKEDRTKFETALSKLLKDSKYAKTNFMGTPPAASRDVVDGSFTYCLLVTFESPQAQDNYQSEEAHLTFIDEAKDLWEKVQVYDAKGLLN